jgi:hypothetical protein
MFELRCRLHEIKMPRLRQKLGQEHAVFHEKDIGVHARNVTLFEMQKKLISRENGLLRVRLYAFLKDARRHSNDAHKGGVYAAGGDADIL